MWTFLILLFVPAALTLEPSTLREFRDSSNLFARDVYKKISKTHNGNFLVSPFPVETLLALTNAGARGSTAEEIQKVLHFPDDPKTFEEALKSLLPKLTKNEVYTLRSANNIYVKKNFSIKDEFKNVASQGFGANCEEIDFIAKDKAAEIINSWIEKQTNNKIKNLINSNDFSDDTRLILINALYFKGNWSHPFPSHLTEKKDFYRSPNDVIQVDTMHIYGKYCKRYEWPDVNAQFLEIPFKGKAVSMVIVLPNEKDGITSLEDNLDRIFSQPDMIEDSYLNVALPKFTMESSIDLKAVLKELGVKQLFDAGKADLGGIAEDLVVNKVMQKSFINVTEGGVEASAGTYFRFELRSWPLEEPTDFIVDRPFMFYIQVEGLVIFVGRVKDPSIS